VGKLFDGRGKFLQELSDPLGPYFQLSATYSGKVLVSETILRPEGFPHKSRLSGFRVHVGGPALQGRDLHGVLTVRQLVMLR
jgi:hypothetical protein